MDNCFPPKKSEIHSTMQMHYKYNLFMLSKYKDYLLMISLICLIRKRKTRKTQIRSEFVMS
jgi:hypothetical protein